MGADTLLLILSGSGIIEGLLGLKPKFSWSYMGVEMGRLELLPSEWPVFLDFLVFRESIRLSDRLSPALSVFLLLGFLSSFIARVCWPARTGVWGGGSPGGG